MAGNDLHNSIAASYHRVDLGAGGEIFSYSGFRRPKMKLRIELLLSFSVSWPKDL